MPLRLLLIDNSTLVRTSLARLLQTIPGVARIANAGSLNQAMQSAKEDVPDLVILDVCLPDGLGLQVIGALKQLSPHLRVAVLTLHHDNSYRQRCLALGSDWLFDKARDIDVLLDVVRQQVWLNTENLRIIVDQSQEEAL